MSQSLWNQVDEYFAFLFHPEDDALAAALAACRGNGFPNISVAPNQGRLLQMLATIRGAKKILEIGTLGGYSSICMARALPEDGELITLEIDPRHAAVARENLVRAGVADKVDVRLGRALDLLPALQSEAPFDLVFIDADKPSNPDYFAWAVKLSRPGTVIVIDNVVREGKVIDSQSKDESVLGVRRLAAAIAAEKRVRATALQTVGSKGYDGLILAVVEQG
ncbi:MAG TPA: O-methyltransferase [Phycisphaerae bacterium]|nr:O-methyltransferase [Phycisphaerae bacterium]